MAEILERRAVISGAGQSQIGRRLFRDPLELTVDACLANAGRGLGKAFLDQDFADIRRVIDTNVTGTVYLLHRIGRDMRARRHGRAHQDSRKVR